MKRKLTLRMMLAAAMMAVGVNSAWAETVNVNSTESAYVLKGSETNYNGTSNALVAYYTQYRNWGTSDGTANFRDNDAKLVLYKFSLSDFKSASGSMTNATLTFTTTSTENCYNVFAVGYKEDWSASTVTGKNLTNNSGTITGVVTATGSFQPLGTGYAELSNGSKATDISIDATTYVQSAIDANLDYVSFAIGINIKRNLPLNSTAKLSGEFTTAAATKYTVKYQNAGGTDLKDAVEYDTYVGETFTASSTDMATFYSDDTNKKYVYASGNTSSTAVADAASNVVTLVFNEYDKISYTVTAKNGAATLGVLASGDAYTDGSTTIYWNKYKQFDDVWYETISPYGKAITEAGNTDIAFTLAPIAYFFEGENLNTSRSGFPTASGTGYSGGSARRNYANGHMWTSAIAEGGTFTLKFPYSMANASASTIVIKTRNSEGDYTDTGLSLSTSSGGTFTNTITIPAGSSVAICNETGNNSNILIDYLTLTPTAVSKTITTAGWATYCSPYALDLSSATGLTDAYIVTGGKNGVLAKMSVKGRTVPANTGLLLKGTEGSAVNVTIPVVASSETDVTANILDGVTANTEITAGSGWVLMNDATNGLGFYRNTNAFTVGANTAYIPVADLAVPGAGARAFYSLFDSETTGVDAALVKNGIVNNEIFNLQGQRVGQPTKGLYIVGGRKVVKK